MRLSDNLKGAALMTGCVSAYVINDAFMKYLFSEMAFFQAIFLRSIISVPPVLIMVWITKVTVQKISHENKRLLWLRVGAEICTTIAF